jgi:ribosomal subunit interface protein
MQINLSGHHLYITDAIRNHVTDKFARLERHSDHIINVHVILELEKNRQKAEAKVHLGGVELFADAEEEDLYVAIDKLVDKLDRQLLKQKEKTLDRAQRGPGRS